MRWMWIALALTIACGKNEQPPPKVNQAFSQESGPASAGSANPDAMAAAQALYARTCAMCHGADGSGDGPAAEALTPKPRNYTDPAWQASITDAEIRKIIVEGGQGVGKSVSMPPTPSLKGDPATLDALVKIIRGFKK
jgi:mono/diheme cytochrome c family protein